MLGGTSRKVLYLDNMVGASAALVDQMRVAYGDLMDPESTKGRPVALVVLDLLKAVGMPDDAICIILGNVLYERINEGTPPTDAALSCEFCDQHAAMVMPYPDGYRITCGDHAYEIANAQYQQTRQHKFAEAVHA